MHEWLSICDNHNIHNSKCTIHWTPSVHQEQPQTETAWVSATWAEGARHVLLLWAGGEWHGLCRRGVALLPRAQHRSWSRFVVKRTQAVGIFFCKTRLIFLSHMICVIWPPAAVCKLAKSDTIAQDMLPFYPSLGSYCSKKKSYAL
jgi:hypothetical protein